MAPVMRDHYALHALCRFFHRVCIDVVPKMLEVEKEDDFNLFMTKNFPNAVSLIVRD